MKQDRRNHGRVNRDFPKQWGLNPNAFFIPLKKIASQTPNPAQDKPSTGWFLFLLPRVGKNNCRYIFQGNWNLGKGRLHRYLGFFDRNNTAAQIVPVSKL